MKTVFNFHEYYRIYEKGSAIKGYTAITKLLFSPLFSPKQITDTHGVIYEIDNQNGRAWAKGIELIPKPIQNAVSEKKWIKAVVDGFTLRIYPEKIDPFSKEEMLTEMMDSINTSDLNNTKKKKLSKLYDGKKYGEFLAYAFLFSLKERNKVATDSVQQTASDDDSDAVLEFRSKVHGILPRPPVNIPKEIEQEELGYVVELYAAYQDASGVPINSVEDLSQTKYKGHFRRQRKSYYLAESIHRDLRDTILPDEADVFDVLKDEIEAGIDEIRYRPYSNGVEKIDAVMIRASDVQLSPRAQIMTNYWIGPGEKKGVCHMLVGDKRLKWVGDEDDE